MKTLGENLAKIRKNKKLTRAKVSALSGVPESSITTYEQDKAVPSLMSASYLAMTYGVSLDELIGVDTYRNNKPWLLVDDPRESIGERLRRLRQCSEMTIVQAAKRAGLHRNSLATYENDMSVPTLYRAEYLAILYGVPLDYLAGMPLKKIEKEEAKQKIYVSL